MHSYYSISQSMYMNYDNYMRPGSSTSDLDAKLMQLYSQHPVAPSIPTPTPSLAWPSPQRQLASQCEFEPSISDPHLGIVQTESLNPLDLSIRRAPATSNASRICESAFWAFNSPTQRPQQTLSYTHTHSQLGPQSFYTEGHGHAGTLPMIQQSHRNTPFHQDRERPKSVIHPYNPSLPSFYSEGAGHGAQIPPYSQYYYNKQEGLITQQHYLKHESSYPGVYRSDYDQQSLQGIQHTAFNHSVGSVGCGQGQTYRHGNPQFASPPSAGNGSYSVAEMDPSAFAPPAYHSTRVSQPIPTAYHRYDSLASSTTTSAFSPISLSRDYYPNENSSLGLTMPHVNQKLNLIDEVSKILNSDRCDTKTANQARLTENNLLVDEMPLNKSVQTLINPASQGDDIQTHPEEQVPITENVKTGASTSSSSVYIPSEVEGGTLENIGDEKGFDQNVPVAAIRRINDIEETSQVVSNPTFNKIEQTVLPVGPASICKLNSQNKNRNRSSVLSTKKRESKSISRSKSVQKKKRKIDLTNDSHSNGQQAPGKESRRKTNSNSACESKSAKAKVGSDAKAASSWTSRLRARKTDDRDASCSAYKKKLRSSVQPDTQANSNSDENKTESKDDFHKREQVVGSKAVITATKLKSKTTSRKKLQEKKVKGNASKEVHIVPEGGELTSVLPSDFISPTDDSNFQSLYQIQFRQDSSVISGSTTTTELNLLPNPSFPPQKPELLFSDPMERLGDSSVVSRSEKGSISKKTEKTKVGKTKVKDGIASKTEKTTVNAGTVSKTEKAKVKDGTASRAEKTKVKDGTVSKAAKTKVKDGTLSKVEQNKEGSTSKTERTIDGNMSKQEIINLIKSWELNKRDGETILHRASRLGIADVTLYCLKDGMISSPNCVNTAGYSPLHEACLQGHLKVAEALLFSKAGPSKSAPGGIRPLHLASKNGHIEIVRLLLSFGVDPWIMTDSGYTAWDFAEPYPEIRSILQQYRGENKTNTQLTSESLEAVSFQ